MAIARLGRVLAAGSVCLLIGGCDSSGSVSDDFRASAIYYGEPGSRDGGFGGVGEPRRLWGPCESLGRGDDWHCSGEPGNGLACLRPVSNWGANVCVPQTADVFVDADCGNVYEPDYGLGVRLQGSAYCVIDCDSDNDCGDGMRCSPTSHFCAFVE